MAKALQVRLYIESVVHVLTICICVVKARFFPCTMSSIGPRPLYESDEGVARHHELVLIRFWQPGDRGALT